MDTPSFAPEYTPELSKSYLSSLLEGIDNQGRVDEGRANAEAESRGLGGQLQGGNMVATARAGTAMNRASTIGAFNLDVANKTREERMAKTNRGYAVEDRDFGAVEAQKSRDFQEKMAQLGYQYGDASARRDMIYGQQGAVLGAGLETGSQAAGSSLAMMMMSDRRLKKNIVAVGQDGPLTVYEFDYLSAEHPSLDLPTSRMRGYMADEVETHFPDHVSERGGFKCVTSRFSPVGV